MKLRNYDFGIYYNNPKDIKNGEKTIKLHKFVKKLKKTLAKKKFLCYYKIIEIENLKGD